MQASQPLLIAKRSRAHCVLKIAGRLAHRFVIAIDREREIRPASNRTLPNCISGSAHSPAAAHHHHPAMPAILSTAILDRTRLSLMHSLAFYCPTGCSGFGGV